MSTFLLMFQLIYHHGESGVQITTNSLRLCPIEGQSLVKIAPSCLPLQSSSLASLPAKQWRLGVWEPGSMKGVGSEWSCSKHCVLNTLMVTVGSPTPKCPGSASCPLGPPQNHKYLAATWSTWTRGSGHRDSHLALTVWQKLNWRPQSETTPRFHLTVMDGTISVWPRLGLRVTPQCIISYSVPVFYRNLSLQ